MIQEKWCVAREAVPYGRDNAAILEHLRAAGWPADRLCSYLKAEENLENPAGDSERRYSQSGERGPMSASVRLGTVWSRRSGAEQGCSRHVGAWRALACACVFACVCVRVCVRALKRVMCLFVTMRQPWTRFYHDIFSADDLQIQLQQIWNLATSVSRFCQELKINAISAVCNITDHPFCNVVMTLVLPML